MWNELRTSAIDHLYTSINLQLKILPSISDHDMIVVSLEISTTTRQKITSRDWRKYNKDLVAAEFAKKTQISDSLLSHTQFSTILTDILNEVAPERVIRIKDNQIVSHKLEKLKKKRDRAFKLFRKTGSVDCELLRSIKDMNKKIRKLVKTESVRNFQNKAKSPDPKVFWQAVNQTLGKLKSTPIELENDGQRIADKGKLCQIFGNFFQDKVASLSTKPSMKIILAKPSRLINLSAEEIRVTLKNVKRKKCYGVDGIPQVLLKDAFDCSPESLTEIFNDFAKNGLPKILKEARVLPLHKKGSRFDV